MTTPVKFIAMDPEQWDLLCSIIRKYPQVQRELNEAEIRIREIEIATSYELVNSDDEVIATYPYPLPTP